MEIAGTPPPPSSSSAGASPQRLARHSESTVDPAASSTLALSFAGLFSRSVGWRGMDPLSLSSSPLASSFPSPHHTPLPPVHCRTHCGSPVLDVSRSPLASHVLGKRRRRLAGNALSSAIPPENDQQRHRHDREEEEMEELADRLRRKPKLSSSPPSGTTAAASSTSPSHHASFSASLVSLPEVERQLLGLERRVQDAIPYSKHGSGRDAYTYHRIRPRIEDVQKWILLHAHKWIHGARGAQGSITWKECMMYLNVSMRIALRLPEFDCSQHNAMKRELVRKLGRFYLMVLEEMVDVSRDLVPSNAPVLEASAQSLAEFLSGVPTSGDGGAGGGLVDADRQVLEPVVALFKRKLGWLTTTTPTSS